MPLRRLRAGVQPSYPTICRERRELGTASPAPPTAPGRCDAPRAPLTYPKLRRALYTTKLGAKPAAGPRHPRSRAPDALLPARRSHKSAQRSAAERGPRSWAEAAALLEQRSEATRKTKDCDATFKNPKKKKKSELKFSFWQEAEQREQRSGSVLEGNILHASRGQAPVPAKLLLQLRQGQRSSSDLSSELCQPHLLTTISNTTLHFLGLNLAILKCNSCSTLGCSCTSQQQKKEAGIALPIF